jgi:hypothetical protein
MQNRNAFIILAAALMIGTPLAASGQTLDSEYQNVVTVNPLGLVFGILSVEVERPRTPNSSIGVAASVYSVSSYTNYLSAEGKYRYYPQGEALHGFSIGGGGGFTAVTQSCGAWESMGCESDTFFGLTVGLGLDYQWFMGDDDRFAVAAGIGAKRLFVSGNVFDANLGYPTIRLGVGYAL